MISPTSRTLQRLRLNGVTCQVVEHWNPYGGPRKPDGTPVGNRVDLFGIIDIVVLDDGILGIQATSGDNLAHRRVKAEAEPRLLEWLRNGGKFELWGWRKLKKTGRWEVRRIVATNFAGVVEWVE